MDKNKTKSELNHDDLAQQGVQGRFNSFSELKKIKNKRNLSLQGGKKDIPASILEG